MRMMIIIDSSSLRGSARGQFFCTSPKSPKTTRGVLVHPTRNNLVLGFAIWDFRHPPLVIRERRCNLAQNMVCALARRLARRNSDVKSKMFRKYAQIERLLWTRPWFFAPFAHSLLKLRKSDRFRLWSQKRAVFRLVCFVSALGGGVRKNPRAGPSDVRDRCVVDPQTPNSRRSGSRLGKIEKTNIPGSSPRAGGRIARGFDFAWLLSGQGDIFCDSHYYY